MAETRRIALLVEYDGATFAGSQAQPGRPTVQLALETAIEAFLGEKQRVRFAGRTDAGVHAVGQVVTLDTKTAHPPQRVRDALNHFLPEEVAVRAACEVSSDFDPRRDATSRLYRYVIEDGRPRSPLTRRRAWQRRDPLDAPSMSQAAALLPRERCDWSAFAGPLAEDRSALRTLHRCEVQRRSPHRLEVWMEADAFLAHQVRRTVGALERVGVGRMQPEEFAGLMEAPPASVGPAAPPQGLTLMTVHYPEGAVDFPSPLDEVTEWTSRSP
jgi:tRNA pseudouridine38-40 synthase